MYSVENDGASFTVHQSLPECGIPGEPKRYARSPKVTAGAFPLGTVLTGSLTSGRIRPLGVLSVPTCSSCDAVAPPFEPSAWDLRKMVLIRPCLFLSACGMQRAASDEAEEPAVEELAGVVGRLREITGSLEKDLSRDEKEILVLVVLGA